VITINGPEVFGARPGESEENLTTILDKALIFTEEGPTILFFDEIDTLCPDNRHSDAEKGVNLSRLLMDFFDRIVGNDKLQVHLLLSRKHYIHTQHI
jgi:SpoVK/Ycf46/Vps4 family AAA+-type ATPase